METSACLPRCLSSGLHPLQAIACKLSFPFLWHSQLLVEQPGGQFQRCVIMGMTPHWNLPMVALYKALDQVVCHCLQPNHLLSDGTMPVLADCMHVFCIYEERLSVEVLADLTFRDNKPLTLCRADYILTTHIPAWHFACQEQRHHLHRAQWRSQQVGCWMVTFCAITAWMCVCVTIKRKCLTNGKHDKWRQRYFKSLCVCMRMCVFVCVCVGGASTHARKQTKVLLSINWYVM